VALPSDKVKRGHCIRLLSSLKQLILVHFNRVLFWICLLTNAITTWWKTATRFPLLETEHGFLVSFCFLTSVQTFWKIDCTHTAFKDMLDVSAVVLQSVLRRRHHSLMLHACETIRQASLHIKCPTNNSLLLFKQTVDGLYLPVFPIYCCSRFYSATCPDWFCWTSYTQIPAAVVESEIRVADFRQVAPLYVVNTSWT